MTHCSFDGFKMSSDSTTLNASDANDGKGSEGSEPYDSGDLLEGDDEELVEANDANVAFSMRRLQCDVEELKQNYWIRL